MNKKTILLILDGWGLGKPDKFNAIENAKTPNFDKLVRDFPNTRLKSDGLAVGLPEGQSGTSEVNHMTIGAGRIIFQDLPKINLEIENGTFKKNEVLLSSIQNAIENNSKIHLVGIYSDGGIHSKYAHMNEIISLISEKNFEGKVCLHLFTDGRDTPPRSVEKFLRILDEQIKKFSNLNISFSTYQGRFYLDRDRDWAKTEKAVNLICKSEGKLAKNWEALVHYEYNQNVDDEFFPQYVLDTESKIEEGDSVIFTHYRTDRLYQLLKGIIQESPKNVHFSTFIKISEEFENVNVAFPRNEIKGTLAEAISKAGKTQLHVTETEKFPHVTFFLNGENEHQLPLEDWEKIESNRFVKPYYNFEPNMQNFKITNIILEAIEKNKYDFIIANLSSPDMVGHTGNYESAVVSAESIDYCLGKIYEKIKDKLDEYAVIITADHGNSEIMWDYENNQPHTQHTLNPVPFILISDLKCKLERRETLQDIAPTILHLMGLVKPIQMEGNSLINLD